MDESDDFEVQSEELGPVESLDQVQIKIEDSFVINEITNQYAFVDNASIAITDSLFIDIIDQFVEFEPINDNVTVRISDSIEISTVALESLYTNVNLQISDSFSISTTAIEPLTDQVTLNVSDSVVINTANLEPLTDTANLQLSESLDISTVAISPISDSVNLNLADRVTISTLNLEPLNDQVGIEIVDSLAINTFDEEETHNNQTTIDGKPIEEWLFSDNTKTAEHVTPVQSNNRLQTTPNPVITNNRPEDILNTIKKYHNVRLDDAKRTLR